MLGLEPVILAVALIAIGTALYFGTRSLLRADNPFQLEPPDLIEQNIFQELEHPETQNGLFVLQRGGKIVYANQVLREWLNLPEGDLPNLEHLARRTRPSETFLELCASPGQQRFSLKGMLVDGVSYTIPYKSGTASLVTLQRPDLSSLTSTDSNLSSQALTVLSELSVAMTSNASLEETIQSILESVERLIPSDISEITIYDPDQKLLVPHRITGMPSPDRELQQPGIRYNPGEGYTGHLFKSKKPLLIPEVATFKEVRPLVDAQTFPFQAYVGVPLLIGSNAIGTLELGSLTAGSYQERDLEILEILSNQAAIALQHAQTRQEEARRVAELSGLANLAQAIGGQTQTSDLIAQILERVQPLLDVEILGFLLYDEHTHQLSAQIPFFGIPDEFKDYYVVDIPPGSEAERIWHSQEPISAANAPQDAVLQVMGLSHVAQAAGLRNSLLAPLTIGGRSVGYFQAANKRSAEVFNEDDIRLATIIAGQVAPLLENAALLQETRRRALQAEALRRIAGLAGSVATLDEIFQFSLREVAQLLQADSAVFLLLDEDQYRLSAHHESAIGIASTDMETFPGLNVEDGDFSNTASSSLNSFSLEVIENNIPGASFYIQVAQSMKCATLISVPLIVRDRGLGELVLGSHQPGFFQKRDIEIATNAAGQIASAIERVMLSSQTDESLRRRVSQLTSLTRISRELNASLELEQVMKLVYNEALVSTAADCGSILLFDLQEGSEEKPTILLSVGDGHDQEISLLPLEQAVFNADEPILIERFDVSDYDPPHKGVKSSMVLPISYQNQILGLFNLHARRPSHFNPESLDIAQALASQAAIALGNARKFHTQLERGETLKRGLDTLSRILAANQALRDEQPLENSLAAIAEGISETTPVRTVLISVYDPGDQSMQHLCGTGFPEDIFVDLQSQTIPWSSVAELLQPEIQQKNSYIVPDEKLAPVSPEHHLTNWVRQTNGTKNGTAWRPEVTLITPLWTADREPLGLISTELPAALLLPDQAAIETIEIFARQAALTIENHARFSTFKSQVGNLEREIQRLQNAGHEAVQNIPILLKKDLDQVMAIKRTNLRSRLIQQAMEIIRHVNKQGNRAGVLAVLGEELVAKLGFDIGIVAEASEKGTILSHLVGQIPERVNPEALLGQRNPLRQTLQNGETFLVPSLRTNGSGSTWGNSPLLTNLNTESFVCLPIPSLRDPDKQEAAFLGIKRLPSQEFTPEDQRIFTLIGDQVSITLENIKLLDETKNHLREVDLLLNFGRQIGSLDPSEILRILADNVLEVVTRAEGLQIALWDTNQESLVPQLVRGYRNNGSIQAVHYENNQALPGRAFALGEVMRVDEVNIAHDYNLPYEELLSYQHGTDDRVPISSLILPLKASDSILGVLVLDNFSGTQAFSKEDEALATSLASQTGVILENARLLEDAEQRARQLQSLTNVSTTITSDLQVDTITASLLDHISEVIPFETGTFWMRQGNLLNIRAAQGFDDDEERIGLTVDLADSRLLHEMIQSGQVINVPNVHADERFPAVTEHPHLSWLGIPLIAKGNVVGVIALEKKEAGYYNQTHLQIAATFAAQAAVALENARLYEESLQRSRELDERTQRLDLLNRLSNEFSGSLDPTEILQFTVEKLLDSIDCLAVSAIIFEKKKAFLKAEAPNFEEWLPIELDVTPFAQLRESLGVIVSDDVLTDEKMALLQDFWEQRQTQAAVVLSVVSGSQLHGLLILHGESRFSDNAIDLARTISYQVATALQNAQLFERTQSALRQAEEQARRLASLNDMGAAITLATTPQEILNIAAENTPHIIPADQVSIALLDPRSATFQIQARGGVRLGKQDSTIYPLEGSAIQAAIERNELILVNEPGEPAFEPVALLMSAPLPSSGGVLGTINLGKLGPGGFSENEQNLLLQVATLVSATIVNKNLLDETRRLTEELEERVEERTRELAVEHQRIETLLGIITELSASLDMDIVLNRTLALINRITGAEHSSIMLASPADSSLVQRAFLGFTPPILEEEGEALSNLNHLLAGWVIRQREAELIPLIKADPRWNLKEQSTIKSTMAVPLMLGPEALGALILFHRQQDSFTDHHLDMIQAAAKQIAVALNNSQLYHLIRDQAERLGGMLRTQQIEASRLLAILEAVADGVLVTDARGVISVFNASAERILDLEHEKVVGEPLENFTGFFGQAGQDYMETIQRWSSDPGSLEEGETYSEEIELDDDRVVAVNLAPVSSPHEFLGTVSIFRDITHLIEVDRLKSEFVATVSHELRTPMTSIKGYVDILLMGAAGELTQQQSEFLQVVQGNTERLNILVNDLLEVTRIEAGKISLAPQAVDVVGVAGEVATDYLLQSREQDKAIDITVDSSFYPPLVFADPDRLRQILDNLISNAYHYTPDNGNIQVRFKANGELVQVDIEDNGVGVSIEDQDRIFERFFRGDAPLVSTTAGTGLGLSIVKYFVELHGGKIWLKSSGVPGDGTTFSFTLPIFEEEHHG